MHCGPTSPRSIFWSLHSIKWVFAFLNSLVHLIQATSKLWLKHAQMLIYILLVAFSYPVQNGHLLNYSSPLHLLTPKKNWPMLAGPGHLLIVLSCSWHTPPFFNLCNLCVCSFSLLDSLSKEMDLWVPLGIAHLCGSFKSATQNIWIVSKTIVSFGFHSICHNWWLAFSFPFGLLVLRYFKDSLGTHTLFHCPFSLMSEWSFNSLMKEVQVSIGLGTRLFKCPFPYA
jgi:hypothetical protein